MYSVADKKRFGWPGRSAWAKSAPEFGFKAHSHALQVTMQKIKQIAFSSYPIVKILHDDNNDDDADTHPT